KVNGKEVSKIPGPGNYVELTRKWKTGDTVELVLPKKLHEDPIPDNPKRVALMWGPLVLAGDIGPENRRRRPNREDLSVVPVFVAGDRDVSQWLKPVADKPGDFHTDGVGHDRDIDFVPFYRLHERTYAVYWDLYTDADWQKRAQQVELERQHQKKLE